MPLTVPAPVLQALWHLEHAGYPAYIVGGSLRDVLMGRTPHDWDVTTAARPEQMLDIFTAAGLATIPTGLKHGTVTVLVDHIPIECTTYRIDGAYTDARHPDHVAFTDRIADDLARRDFTVNAMACRLPDLRAQAAPPKTAVSVDMADAEPVDLHGGREDLASGTLRCVGDAHVRFTEDALRMLRAVRFCVQLEFDIAPETEQALADCRRGLTHISAERIASELMRTLACPHPSRGLALMRKTGLWDFVLPEACPAENPYFANENDLFLAVDALPPSATLRLALLLSDGNADTARACCRRLKLSNKQTEAVLSHVSVLTAPVPEADATLRRLMAEQGDHTAHSLALRAACAPEHERAVWENALDRAACIRARGDCLRLADLAVDGRALMTALGLGGRDVGNTLHALLDAVLDDPSLNTREQLLSLAKRTK